MINSVCYKLYYGLDIAIIRETKYQSSILYYAYLYIRKI